MMKKTHLFLIVLIAFVGSISAQTNNIDGVWKLTEMNEAGEVYPVNMHLIFNDAGEIEMSGENVGTWSQNETENTFTINCNYLGVLQGENKIEVLNDIELKISNTNGDVNSFQKISLPKNKELHNKITGDWFFEKMERKGETNFVGALAQFNKNGIFYIANRVSGSWNYSESSTKIIFNTTEFKGEYVFSQPNKNELIITIDKDKLFFSKIDKQKIINENKASGLMDTTWKVESKNNLKGRIFITFKTPDEFVYVVKNEYRQQNGSGMWIFDKEGMILSMNGFYNIDMPEGESKITKLNDDRLEIENNGKTYSLTKQRKSDNKIEHLTYSREDFFDETGDYLYYDDENKLPWNDSLEMMMTLVNVKQLVYKYSTLIEEVNVFESKILIANVNSNPQEQELSIDYIFYGYDNYNLPDDTALPTRKYDTYSKLYPEVSNTFRVVGEEEITTLLGTFNCAVVEAIEGSNNIKIWMIIDKPGIFAKIIKENTDDMYGYYHVYKLQDITIK